MPRAESGVLSRAAKMKSVASWPFASFCCAWTKVVVIGAKRTMTEIKASVHGVRAGDDPARRGACC